MKVKVVVHEAEEGGYWAGVPAIPGCPTQGETFQELLQICTKPRKGAFPLSDIAVEARAYASHFKHSLQ